MNYTGSVVCTHHYIVSCTLSTLPAGTTVITFLFFFQWCSLSYFWTTGSINRNILKIKYPHPENAENALKVILHPVKDVILTRTDTHTDPASRSRAHIRPVLPPQSSICETYKGNNWSEATFGLPDDSYDLSILALHREKSVM